MARSAQSREGDAESNAESSQTLASRVVGTSALDIRNLRIGTDWRLLRAHQLLARPDARLLADSLALPAGQRPPALLGSSPVREVPSGTLSRVTAWAKPPIANLAFRRQ